VSVSLSVQFSPSWALQKWLNQSRCDLGWWLRWAVGTIYHVLDGAQILQEEMAIFWGTDGPLWSNGTFYGELCKNDSTDWDAVLDEISVGSKEPCVRRGLRSPQEGALLRGVDSVEMNGSCRLHKNAWIHTFAEYIIVMVLASAIYTYNSLPDRRLYLREISNLELILQKQGGHWLH